MQKLAKKDLHHLITPYSHDPGAALFLRWWSIRAGVKRDFVGARPEKFLKKVALESASKGRLYKNGGGIMHDNVIIVELLYCGYPFPRTNGVRYFIFPPYAEERIVKGSYRDITTAQRLAKIAVFTIFATLTRHK